MLPRRLFLLSGLCGFCCCCGCGGTSAPARHAMRGTVNVGGTAIAKGSISFFPMPGVAGSPATTAIVRGEYRFTEENGPFAGEHRVVVGIETEYAANWAAAGAGSAGATGVSTGIKVAPPPDDALPSGAKSRAAASPKTQWELQVKIDENGDNRKDFDLSG